MRKIVMQFTNGKAQGKIQEIIEVDDSTTDEELDELLTNWLFEKFQAVWWEKSDETR